MAATKGLVVITGASAGFGEATAHAFAKLGYPLALGARRMERLEGVKAACQKLGAPAVRIEKLDVRDAKSIQAFCAAVETPAVLVNNAGLARGKESVAEAREEDLLEMLDTNVTGLLRVTRGFLPRMIAAKSGHIVNVGSISGRDVYEGGVFYCATKHAVRAISQGLRLELLGTNLRVTEIQPGMAETEFSTVRLRDEGKAKSVYQGLKALSADDVADAIVWAATRPPHVNVAELLITPTAQASVSKIHRG